MGKHEDEHEDVAPAEAPDADELDSSDRARRRLLKLTVYVAPAVIGTLLIGRSVHAQTASCVPAQCSPNTTPCVPSTCRPRN